MTRKVLRLPNGMRPDRNEQRRRGLIGTLRRMNAQAPKPTLAPVAGPTLAEIEAKYGR
jgi:hypothetical protein